MAQTNYPDFPSTALPGDVTDTTGAKYAVSLLIVDEPVPGGRLLVFDGNPSGIITKLPDDGQEIEEAVWGISLRDGSWPFSETPLRFPGPLSPVFVQGAFGSRLKMP